MFYIHGLLPERFSPSQRIHIWPAHIRNMRVKLKKAVLVSAHFWSPIDFSDLRSHLLIIHTLLFSRQYKSVPTSLPSNKLYWDLTRVRKNRICPNCKRRSANFPKSWQEWKKKGNGVMGRGKWTIPFNKGSLNHSLSARQLSSCFSRGGHKYTQKNLLESYSLDSTYLSYAEKVVQRRSVHVLAREAFLVQSESNWVRVD